MKIKDIALLGMLGSILFITQVVLAFLPNIELVSLLVIVYTQKYQKKALYTIYIFALLEGLFYGFGIWWIMYLYVWTILWFIVLCFRKNTQAFFWALVSGAFGISFGALCSVPYFIIGGIRGGFAYWVSGIPFDIPHGIGNFIIALALYRPITCLFQKSRYL